MRLLELHPPAPLHRLAASAAAATAATSNTVLRLISRGSSGRRGTTDRRTTLLWSYIIPSTSRYRRLDVIIRANQLI